MTRVKDKDEQNKWRDVYMNLHFHIPDFCKINNQALPVNRKTNIIHKHFLHFLYVLCFYSLC